MIRLIANQLEYNRAQFLQRAGQFDVWYITDRDNGCRFQVTGIADGRENQTEVPRQYR